MAGKKGEEIFLSEKGIEQLVEMVGGLRATVEDGFAHMEERMDRLEERMDRLEERMDRLESEQQQMKDSLQRAEEERGRMIKSLEIVEEDIRNNRLHIQRLEKTEEYL